MAKAKKNAHLWERDPNDWYPEPPWTAEALFATTEVVGPLIDPCAGLGHIVRAAQKAGHCIEASDLIERHRPGVKGGIHYAAALMCTSAKTVVTNPPFKEAQQLIALALSLGLDVAAFLQLRFAGGETRSKWMETTPLASIGILAPRPSCPPGAVWLAGEATGSGGEVDHAWFVWRQGWTAPPVLKWMRREG